MQPDRDHCILRLGVRQEHSTLGSTGPIHCPLLYPPTLPGLSYRARAGEPEAFPKVPQSARRRPGEHREGPEALKGGREFKTSPSKPGAAARTLTWEPKAGRWEIHSVLVSLKTLVKSYLKEIFKRPGRSLGLGLSGRIRGHMRSWHSSQFYRKQKNAVPPTSHSRGHQDLGEEMVEPPGVLSGKRPQDPRDSPMQTRLVPTRGLPRPSFWPILEGEAGTESPQPPTAFLTAAGLQTISSATQGLLIA